MGFQIGNARSMELSQCFSVQSVGEEAAARFIETAEDAGGRAGTSS